MLLNYIIIELKFKEKKITFEWKDTEYIIKYFTPKINGGDANNKVCDKASMVLDIRFVSDIKEDWETERLFNNQYMYSFHF